LTPFPFSGESGSLLKLNWEAGVTRAQPVRINQLRGSPRKESVMLWTIAVVLLVLWILGLVSSHTMGGFIHILLVIAVVMILVRVINGL